MLDRVDLPDLLLEPYREVTPDSVLDEVVELGERLRGVRVLHVNSTPYGGGVAELLESLVPLERAAGLDAEWRVLLGTPAFYEVTKALHNGLQGAAEPAPPDALRTYLAEVAAHAPHLPDGYDVAVAHDPQPMALATFRPEAARRWVWRCHVDTSRPAPWAWALVRRHLGGYDASVFSTDGFAPEDVPTPVVAVSAPAIDPLRPKNRPLDPGERDVLLADLGVPADVPLVTQVSRFDPWKDPVGVLHAHRLAREAVPDLHLVLAGSMPVDDPEGARVLADVQALAGRDPAVHLLHDLSDVEVNALQTFSDVVVQKSLREGFGLTVSEALWKGTPVVAGAVGGIPQQLPQGVGGLLVDGVEECADAIVHLVRDPVLARRLGELGRARVRDHFLMPRMLRDELRLIARLVGA